MQKVEKQFFCPHCKKPIEAAKINRWKAAQAGRVTSEKKAVSSAENGKKGGRPKKKIIKNDYALDVIKDGMPYQLMLVKDCATQFHLYVAHPDGQKVLARIQPKVNESFPDIIFLAKKNKFELAE